MDNSWQIQNAPEESIAEEPIQKRSLQSKVISKKILFWSIVGIIFFAVYTGGSYYVLFMRNETPTKEIPVIPTLVPRNSPTPLPSPTPVPTLAPIVSETTTWLTYTNKTYGISLTYPPNMLINFNKTSSGIEPYLILLTYPDASQSGQLRIDIQDVQYVGQSDTDSRAIMALNLQEFAEKKWESNKTYQDLTIPLRNIGDLQFITFSGQSAYSFTVVGSYADDRTYEKLSQEYTYIMTEYSGYKMIISYPTSDTILNQIVKTIMLQES